MRENGDDWRLDLTTLRWTRLTNRNWRQWQLTRTDQRPNQLWRVRSVSRLRDMRWAEEYRESMEAMVQREIDAVRAEYGADPNLDAFAKLYDPPVSHETLTASDEEVGGHRISVEGTAVRYVEMMSSVRMVAEGTLQEPTAAALRRGSSRQAVENRAHSVRGAGDLAPLGIGLTLATVKTVRRAPRAPSCPARGCETTLCRKTVEVPQSARTRTARRAIERSSL